jgi:hypothetical protein
MMHSALWLIKEAPVVKNVSPGWHDKLFNGSFLHQNEYRQPANPETDAAWEALGVNCEFVRYLHVRWWLPSKRGRFASFALLGKNVIGMTFF